MMSVTARVHKIGHFGQITVLRLEYRQCMGWPQDVYLVNDFNLYRALGNRLVVFFLGGGGRGRVFTLTQTVFS